MVYFGFWCKVQCLECKLVLTGVYKSGVGGLLSFTGLNKRISEKGNIDKKYYMAGLL